LDALDRHDLDAFLGLVDPDVDFADLIVELEGGVPFRGYEGIRSWWHGYLTVFPNLSLEIDDVRDLGDMTLVRGRVRGHGTESDASFEQTFWTVGEWRDKKLVWSRSFRSEADAVEAAARSD
jgi:ketosteroid isomerase-like protein